MPFIYVLGQMPFIYGTPVITLFLGVLSLLVTGQVVSS